MRFFFFFCQKRRIFLQHVMKKMCLKMIRYLFKKKNLCFTILHFFRYSINTHTHTDTHTHRHTHTDTHTHIHTYIHTHIHTQKKTFTERILLPSPPPPPLLLLLLLLATTPSCLWLKQCTKVNDVSFHGVNSFLIF